MEDYKNCNNSWKNIRNPKHNLNYFDQPFSEAQDALYCRLNDIDRLFLDDNEDVDCKEEDSDFIRDPRTGQIVKRLVVNFSTCRYENNAEIFNKFPQKSSITVKDHKLTVVALKHKLLSIELTPTQQEIIDKIKMKRSEETVHFVEFVKNYSINNFDQIYTANKEFNSLYKKYYQRVMDKTLNSPNRIFSLQTGIPLPHVADASNKVAHIDSLRVIQRTGYVPMYDQKFCAAPLKCRLNSIWDFFIENTNEICYNTESLQNRNFDVFLPRESLLFLMSISDNCETSSEMCFEIFNNGIKNCIKFGKPMPSQNLGLHTNRFVFQKLLETHLSRSVNTKMGKLNNRELKFESVKNEKELHAVNCNQQFKVHSFESYMEQYHMEPPESELKNNRIEVSWVLKDDANGSDLHILSSRQIDFCFNEITQLFLNYSPKLEYKKCFGGEVLTKFELLDEWIGQKFLPNSFTERHRIDSDTFNTLGRQKLSIAEIEMELENLYDIHIGKLLGSLKTFLHLFSNFNTGHYLLRSSNKFRDRLMIYRESASSGTAASITLHDIMKTDVTDLQFYNKRQFVPIDTTCLVDLHERCHVIPGCFPPWKQEFNTNMINDRTLLVEKAQKKIDDATKLKRKIHKSKNKAARKQKRKVQRLQESKEVHELTTDMQQDEMLCVYK